MISKKSTTTIIVLLYGNQFRRSSDFLKLFVCSFAVKSEQIITERGLEIVHPGKFKKIVQQVQQVSFSGKYAMEKKQEVFYITERAVFKLTSEGLMLTEIAHGIELQKDVIDLMDFCPIISPELKMIDPIVFSENKVGLKEKFKISL